MATPAKMYTPTVLQEAVQDYRKLFIHNLDFKLGSEDLMRIFGSYG